MVFSLVITWTAIFHYADVRSTISIIFVAIGLAAVSVVSAVSEKYNPKNKWDPVFKEGFDSGWKAAIKEAKKSVKKAVEEAVEEIDNED